MIDGKGHLLGRLASIVAKQLLNGQKVVIVRCEELNVSGSFFRNKREIPSHLLCLYWYPYLVKYHQYLHKRCVVNPRHGPFHFRAPSRMFYRVVRGMVPHKTPRGAAALERLKVFEGVPPPYDTTKRLVVPDALRVLKLKPGRKYTVLGRLATEVGWKYAEVVSKLEEKRKTKSAAYYQREKSKRRLITKAKQNVASKLAPVKSTLEKYGYTLWTKGITY